MLTGNGLPANFDHDRAFYTLPIALLDAIVQEVGAGVFDPDALALERTLSVVSGDHSSTIGFYQKEPIRYDLLVDRPTVAQSLAACSIEELESVGLTTQVVQNTAASEEMTQRLNWINDVARGYCGWLVLNPQFVSEHDAFIEYMEPFVGSDVVWTESKRDDYMVRSQGFFDRWQLERFVGPYLPLPLRMQLPLLMPTHQFEALRRTGAAVFIPLICPIPDRQMFKEMLQDAKVTNQSLVHLREWTDIVHSANPGKKMIDHYGRIFRLQHFWRNLFQRHGPVLERSHDKVRRAFASYLFPDASAFSADAHKDSIRKDLTAISRALGSAAWWV